MAVSGIRIASFWTPFALTAAAIGGCAEESPPLSPVYNPIESGAGRENETSETGENPCAQWEDGSDQEADDQGGFKFDVGEDNSLFNLPASCDEVAGTQTNLGCEFWAVDLPNEWRGSGKSPPAAEQQFAVVVANASSLEPADVKIYLGASAEVLVSASVAVNETHEFQLDPQSISPDRNSDDGVAFRVVSDLPITAYQFNPLDNEIEVYSNDASLLLPTHALGTSYAAVTGDGVMLAIDSNDTEAVSAGAFLSIVANEDDTEISVLPTTSVLPGPLSAIKLDRGAVFTVLSDGSVPGNNLSGTRVISDKPVAAFSGNVATIVPVSAQQCCADHLEHQLIPHDAWGTAYTVAPAASPAFGSDPTVFRLTGAFETTDLYYCPQRPYGAPTRIGATESAVFESFLPFTVHSGAAKQPFGLTEFLESNRAIKPENGQLGDPAMIVLPPTAQFQHKYLFAVPRGYALNHLTIVGPGGQWMLDGVRVPAVDRQDLGMLEGRMFYFARLKIDAGSHTVEASVPVGVTVTGMDEAVSYGFPGGVGLHVIAAVPPEG